MISQLWTQCALGMLHVQEQLFMAVCSAKHTHYMLGVGNKVRELSRWKHVVLIEIEDVASKKLGLLNNENQCISSAVVMIFLYSYH